MANPQRGEVLFEALGKQWVLRLGMNELIALQDAMGFKEGDEGDFFAALAQQRSLRTVRLIVTHALRGTSPDATEALAGDIVTDLGLQKVVALVQEALRWAMPEPQAAAAGGDQGKGRSRGGPSS